VVRFINTNGMAFLGPGSEWFWAALQFTALVITFVAIYRQLRLARSASAVEQVGKYRAQFDSERMRRQRLAVLVAIRDGNPIPEAAGESVGNFFEMLATLGRNGHLDIKVFWAAMNTATQIWWAILSPFVTSSRAEYGAAVYGDFEWLAATLNAMDRKAGGVAAFDDAWIAKELAGMIENNQEAIKIETALRSVTVAPPDSLAAGHPVA
jgi:hypothetical protein